MGPKAALGLESEYNPRLPAGRLPGGSCSLLIKRWGVRIPPRAEGGQYPIRISRRPGVDVMETSQHRPCDHRAVASGASRQWALQTEAPVWAINVLGQCASTAHVRMVIDRRTNGCKRVF